MGISENKQRNYILRIFILFLEFNNQNKYSDQVSSPQLYFCGNYRPLLFEPILVQNDVIFLSKMSHSAAGENRGGLKIVMQTCFMGIYMNLTTKTPYNI